MDVLGLTITRTKALPLAPVDGRGGWWNIVRESFAGAWQQNTDVVLEDVMSYFAVYACGSLIASDIAKLRVKLVQEDANRVWTETENPAYSPFLRKPNHFQNRIQFYQWWVTSKLLHGNAYVLKKRDGRGVVDAGYVLDPHRVRPLVSPDGAVFYELKADNLPDIGETVIVPAREIIHDIKVALYHPLVGVSPIHACGLAAMQGLKIQNNSYKLFANMSRPGGVLTAPGAIGKDVAARVKAHWDAEFGGDNMGKIAVLGDGLKFEAMTVNAEDAQLIEQLRWTGENVCACFHVPPYMIGIGPAPAYNNIEALNLQYYSQALQNDIESLELCLDEGLEIKRPMGTEFDLDGLIRMDTPTRVKVAADAIGSGGVSPDEARARWLDLGPVAGGGTPYMQQQNYSLAALDRRDSSDDPFDAARRTPRTPQATPPPDDDDDEDEQEERAIAVLAERVLAAGLHG